MKTFTWVYRPGIMDIVDPMVIKGQAIQEGSKVRITKRIGKAFTWIEDQKGNEQSVWKRALQRS
jgi:hypothetical protein